MRYWILHISLLLLGLMCRAQDTIFTKTQGQLLVRVLEISDWEVKYKNFYNPDGVIRNINNQQVEKIVYENGQEEKRFQKKPEVASEHPEQRPYQEGMFIIEGRHLGYNNMDINDKGALKIMMKRDPSLYSTELTNTLLEAQGNKNKQTAFMILGPACLFGGFYLARYHYYGPSDAAKAKVYLLSGFGLCIGSEVIGLVFRKMKHRSIVDAATLYNNEL